MTVWSGVADIVGARRGASSSPDCGRVFETGPAVGPGRLIAFDGFDGSGKSTLVRRMVQVLRNDGRSAIRVRTPTSHFRRSRMFVLLAKQGRPDIVDPLAVQVAHTADRLQLARRTIVPALESDCDVVVDRYLAGAYGSLQRWNLLPAAWFHELIKEMPTPVLSVYLHVGFERWSERMARRHPRDRTECDPADYGRRISESLERAYRNRMLVLDTSQLRVADCIAAIVADLPAPATAIQPEPDSP
jgi:dTMP kinase